MAEEELKTGVQFEGKEEYIKDVFTEIADYYDEMNEIMSMHMVQGWHKFMMRKAGDIHGKRCLDVGTGTGEIAFHVARTAGEGSTVVGVDITPRMLELAARKESELDLPVKIDWREGDALNLDFPDGSFDLVTSGYMLRNVCDIQKAVSEMHRVLAPGGKVIVAELSKPKNGVIRFFYNIYMKRVKTAASTTRASPSTAASPPTSGSPPRSRGSPTARTWSRSSGRPASRTPGST